LAPHSPLFKDQWVSRKREKREKNGRVGRESETDNEPRGKEWGWLKRRYRTKGAASEFEGRKGRTEGWYQP